MYKEHAFVFGSFADCWNRTKKPCGIDSVNGNRKLAKGSCDSPELVETNAETGRGRRKGSTRSLGVYRSWDEWRGGGMRRGGMSRGWPDAALWNFSTLTIMSRNWIQLGPIVSSLDLLFLSLSAASINNVRERFLGVWNGSALSIRSRYSHSYPAFPWHAIGCIYEV